MNKVIDIADYWQFEISFEKYGLLVFERMHYSELVSWNKEIAENDEEFFSKLFNKTFIKDKNNILLSKISFENISNKERNLFYERYFEKQFNNFKINEDKSIIENFKTACAEYGKKTKTDMEDVIKSIQKQQDRYSKVFNPVIPQFKQIETALKPLRIQEELMSKMLSPSKFNSMQIALESIQRKNELLSSLMLPKSVNPFIGMQDAVRIPSINNYFSAFTLKTLDSLSANLDAFNSLRNSIPKSLFNYEVGFSRNYSNIYRQLNPKWNFLYSETDDSEPYLATKEGQYVPSANAKDIVGAKEIFSDIKEEEIANFLRV